MLHEAVRSPGFTRSSGLWRFAFKQSWQCCVDSQESTKGGTGEQIVDSHCRTGSLVSLHARRCSTPCLQSEKELDTTTAKTGGCLHPHPPLPKCANFQCETSVTRRIQHCASSKGNTCWNRTRTRHWAEYEGHTKADATTYWKHWISCERCASCVMANAEAFDNKHLIAFDSAIYPCRRELICHHRSASQPQ